LRRARLSRDLAQCRRIVADAPRLGPRSERRGVEARVLWGRAHGAGLG